MNANKTRAPFAGLPPRGLLASFGLPPDALDQTMDDDHMPPRALVLTRGAVTLGLRLTSGADFDRDKLNKMDDATLASVGHTLIATLRKHLSNDNGSTSRLETNISGISGHFCKLANYGVTNLPPPPRLRAEPTYPAAAGAGQILACRETLVC